MFRGTETLGDGEFTSTVTAMGGQFNAFTSYDCTAYFERVAKDRLPRVMELEADRMSALKLDAGDLETERGVVLEERNERIEVSPDAIFDERLQAGLYLNHPYRRPLIGWRSEIENISLDNLAKFYRQHYAPDRALLVVAGDVEPGQVEKLAEAAYGHLQASGAVAVGRPSEPPSRALRRIEMQDARVPLAYLRRDYLVPSERSIGPADAAALSVFGGLFGGHAYSRLGKALKEKDRVHEAWCYFGRHLRDHGVLMMGALPTKDLTLAQIEQELDQQIVRLLDGDDLASEEVTRIKEIVMASHIYEQDSQVSLAQRYGAGLTLGKTMEELHTWLDAIEEVEVEDVLRVARAYLRPEASVTGYLSPAAG